MKRAIKTSQKSKELEAVQRQLSDLRDEYEDSVIRYIEVLEMASSEASKVNAIYSQIQTLASSNEIDLPVKTVYGFREFSNAANLYLKSLKRAYSGLHANRRRKTLSSQFSGLFKGLGRSKSND